MAILLAEPVAARPDAPAIVDARGTESWRELDERVDRLVGGLRARGLRRGDTVVAMLGNQRELIEVSLACLHGGWLLVPVNWHWVVDEVAYVLDDAAAAAVVVDRRWVHVAVPALERSAAEVPARIVVGLDDGSVDGSDFDCSGFDQYEALLAASVAPDDVDHERGGPMFYTSGTTGRPKGVRNALATVGGPPEVFSLVAATLRPLVELPPEGGGVQAICGPLYHSAQWMFAMTAIATGTSLVLQHRFDASELLALVDQHEITNLHLVPTQMRRLLDLPVEQRNAFDGSSLRAVLHGAAPCPTDVKRRTIEWLGPIVTEYYGGTEGGFLALLASDEWLARPGSVGRPVSTVEIVVLDDHGRRLGPGEEGDLYFRSLMGNDFEYHNAPEKTSSAHRGDGFGTLGDIGYFDDDGYLYLSDRRVDMVVSGGVNIYPAEIEGVLIEHDAVADIAVFGIPDDEMGEQVRAAIQLRTGWEWSGDLEGELVALSRERLAGYKCPRSFEIHDSLPRNEAGKLQKLPLREPHWAERATRI